MHMKFMLWLDVDVQTELEEPLGFGAYCNKVATRWSRDAWVKRLESRGVKKLPTSRVGVVEKGYRRWMAVAEANLEAGATSR